MGRNLSTRMSMKLTVIRSVIIGVTVSACLGQIFLLPDVSDAYEKIDEAERHIERYPPLHSSFLPMMNVYEIGKYHADLSEENCQAGFPPGCLLRGLIALEHGEPGSDPDENRKLAEKFFRQGCAKSDLPVCQLISETRQDDESRSPEDEERVILGILMTGCDIGAEMPCGDAAQRFFEKGDYRMARSYGTKGCAMKDYRGVPFREARSCQYRKLALEKLARENAVPADPGEQAPAAPEPITAKE